jgi:hypothetical protein
MKLEVHVNDTGKGRVSVEIHPEGDEHGEYVIADFYGGDAEVLAKKMVELYNNRTTN